MHVPKLERPVERVQKRRSRAEPRRAPSRRKAIHDGSPYLNDCAALNMRFTDGSVRKAAAANRPIVGSTVVSGRPCATSDNQGREPGDREKPSHSRGSC